MSLTSPTIILLSYCTWRYKTERANPAATADSPSPRFVAHRFVALPRASRLSRMSRAYIYLYIYIYTLCTYVQVHPEVMLTDTVGFIQKLPMNLVAAFRATLEEVGAKQFFGGQKQKQKTLERNELVETYIYIYTNTRGTSRTVRAGPPKGYFCTLVPGEGTAY